MLRLIVLGSGAGGGFPQWNSAGPGCLRARAGDPAALPRTQSSLAASADGERWLLVNAAPDLRQQIAATPALHPRPAPLRNSPIAAVLLTGGEVDAIAGLLHLRERQEFRLLATPPTLAILEENPIFRCLHPDLVRREAMPLGAPFAPRDAAGSVLGLAVTAFPVPGKVPLFNEGVAEREEGGTVGLAITAGGAVAHYVPGCAHMDDPLRERLRGSACVLFDGTLFADDEMIRAGAGPKTGRRMGHMPVEETVREFAALDVERKLLTHLNNTNPALLADSPEHASLRAHGWEVAHDGMEITL